MFLQKSFHIVSHKNVTTPSHAIQLTWQICSLPLMCLPNKQRWKLRLWNRSTSIHQTHNRISVDIIVILRYNRGSPKLQKNPNQNKKSATTTKKTHNPQFAINYSISGKVSFRWSKSYWLTGIISTSPSGPSQTNSCMRSKEFLIPQYIIQSRTQHKLVCNNYNSKITVEKKVF